MPSALVTGITGQDGSYLAERLLTEGWEIHALVRDETVDGEQELPPGVRQHRGDLSDSRGLTAVLADCEPDVVFNLGGISSVAQSWSEPTQTGVVSGVAVGALLEAAWQVQERTQRPVRFVQASSSEIFGNAEQSPQTESTPVNPTSPYGAAKLYAHAMVSVYRRRGLHASSGILYNHESPRRPQSFVTRKITRGAARVARGLDQTLALGNLDVERDWGWAPDYVDALIRMSSHAAPGDFIIATGVAHTVREFVAAAFAAAGIADWQSHVVTDPRFFRPVESTAVLGDSSKARRELGWAPTVQFAEIVERMVRHDFELLDAGR